MFISVFADTIDYLITLVAPYPQISNIMHVSDLISQAIEVVDLDQKIEMVAELDGHIMGCVVNLSSHPYGCRVIHRVLEHCEDQKTQDKVMGEILACVSMFAQDQYGNYVVQACS
ncbi:hypothetical protein POM88_001666 [Heracleum sosnowskyi]|uniref:PUM-HD domain-containing protein n=1 Tax=Heracleum sosnowskyi TaxID=360622 RepID=A0AAD8NB22_9APIA|nr:hypothetical protein POM88_001666 [Heracleum sosnowskyi]